MVVPSADREEVNKRSTMCPMANTTTMHDVTIQWGVNVNGKGAMSKGPKHMHGGVEGRQWCHCNAVCTAHAGVSPMGGGCRQRAKWQVGM